MNFVKPIDFISEVRTGQATIYYVQNFRFSQKNRSINILTSNPDKCVLDALFDPIHMSLSYPSFYQYFLSILTWRIKIEIPNDVTAFDG